MIVLVERPTVRDMLLMARKVKPGGEEDGDSDRDCDKCTLARVMVRYGAAHHVTVLWQVGYAVG